MSTKDRDAPSSPLDNAENQPPPTVKGREITVEEARASARKAMSRYKSALKELARR